MAIIVIGIVQYVILGLFAAFTCLQSSSTLRIMMDAMLWRPRYQCLCVPTETKPQICSLIRMGESNLFPHTGNPVCA